MNILAVGSHPDDIEYGCGGTLLKYADSGHDVYLLVATQGHMGGNPERRRAEQEESVRLIGAKEVIWGGYRDTEIPVSQALIAEIEDIITRIDPRFVFVHYGNDTHQDHRNLSRAVISAARHIANVLFYEGPTTLEFHPNVFVDVSNVIEKKIALLQAHESQISRTNIKNRSILELVSANGTFRGIQARTAVAEAFMPSRLLINVPEFTGKETL